MKTRNENYRGLALGLAAVLVPVGFLTWVGDVHAAVARMESAKTLAAAPVAPAPIKSSAPRARNAKAGRAATTFPSAEKVTLCSNEDYFTRCNDGSGYANGATCCNDGWVEATKCSLYGPHPDTPTKCAGGDKHTNCPTDEKPFATICLGKPVPTFCGDLPPVPTHCVNGNSPSTICQDGEMVTICLDRGMYATDCPDIVSK